jgi:competence protein ComEC
MAALVLLATQLGRPVRGLPVVALATLCLLVADPWMAREYGFALSVLATAGLVVLAGPLAGVLARWVPRWLALVIAVPFSAHAAFK